ncbi:PREDICTED: sodium- and chloride-dependent GABA transporter 3-like, partial [Rhagoletis zephyria]|uniref:sodium- and chloride-dependent GABA transporter 3-like n=1 Tax=Rhagoletis zephyria TaxID=28612 RepID=UPI0008119F20
MTDTNTENGTATVVLLGKTANTVERTAGATTTKGGLKYREREKWGNKFEFILACMAYAIGLGNVWRFPYLCYKNGGGAFFVPYFIFLLFGAIPILFLEVGIGQYYRSGGITVWRQIAPLFSGIGIGTVAISFILNVYYIVVLSWALLYFYSSFSAVLPWSTCGNWWNTDKCWGPTSNGTKPAQTVPSVTEFWENRVLQISPGIDHPDGLQPELAITLLIAWIVCFFCIFKGVKSTGKAVYVTAIFPYVVITALFIRGVTLPGASEGIAFYLTPRFEKILEAQVWMDAGTQIFFSYAIALGCMTALGSYNEFNNNFYHQLFFLTCMNSGTSFYAGFAIFSVLGYMAVEQGLKVEDVAEQGPGLAFIAYPRAVSTMPWSSFWAVMFFTMILMLGLGSQFVGVEGFVTAMVDLFPGYLRYGRRREWFIAGTCVVSYLIGLTMVTRGGMYVFQIFDFYGASGMCLLFYCFWEAFVIGWVYKADRFYDNIEAMIGIRIIPWFRWCWKWFTPAVTVATFTFYLVTHRALKYNKTYEYPAWGIALGWSLAMVSIVMLPISMAYVWWSTPNMPN